MMMILLIFAHFDERGHFYVMGSWGRAIGPLRKFYLLFPHLCCNFTLRFFDLLAFSFLYFFRDLNSNALCSAAIIMALDDENGANDEYEYWRNGFLQPNGVGHITLIHFVGLTDLDNVVTIEILATLLQPKSYISKDVPILTIYITVFVTQGRHF
jgi:hypothetical protein